MPDAASHSTTDTTAFAAAPSPGGDAGVVGGRYRLVRLVARGGMAEVWEGVDEVLARPVAVKILLPHLARDAAFVERFRREAVAAARLAHPHIVALFDTCAGGGTEAIVMELVRGSSLREVLDREGSLPAERVVAIGAQVADALDHAHRRGLVHRDVKPGNILLSDDGRVLVADFGIAKAAEAASDLTEVGQIVGTAKYLSPEQVEGKPLDARSDLYSLGVVLYEALCGRPPFVGENQTATALARLTSTPLRPRQVRAGVPRALEEALLRAMARQPGDRYPTASALREALLAVNPRAADLDVTDATAARHADATRAMSVVRRADVDEHDTPPAGVATYGRRQRSWVVPTVLIVVVAATLGVVGALVSQTDLGQRLYDAVRPDDPDEITVPEPEADPPAPGDVSIAGLAASFDPPPGDRSEGDGALPAVTDGDAESTWRSERYESRDFGNLKDGVGVVVSLTDTAGLARLEVDSPTSGWAGRVYTTAGDVPGDLSGWGEPVAEASDIDGDHAFDLGGAEARHVLLWFTDLGNGTTEDRPYQVQVGEIRVFG